VAATAGTANRGGGGGGAGYIVGSAPLQSGAAGGSGVVIISMLSNLYTGITVGSPTITTVGDYTVIKFTASGSYTA
jgi:hypothetical protein